jgi:hypothetical protein
MAIDVDRDVDLFHDRVGALREPATPHLVAHLVPLTIMPASAPFRTHQQPPASLRGLPILIA